MGWAYTKNIKCVPYDFQLIELDVARFDLFDMPPVNEYELYMRTFGSSATKQVYVQTNDDNMEREIQTEEIETMTKWSQHPPEDFQCVGGQCGIFRNSALHFFF